MLLKLQCSYLVYYLRVVKNVDFSKEMKCYLTQINVDTSNTSILGITETDCHRIASKFEAVISPHYFHTTRNINTV